MRQMGQLIIIVLALALQGCENKTETVVGVLDSRSKSTQDKHNDLYKNVKDLPPPGQRKYK